jgi:hypothetical protein
MSGSIGLKKPIYVSVLSTPMQCCHAGNDFNTRVTVEVHCGILVMGFLVAGLAALSIDSAIPAYSATTTYQISVDTSIGLGRRRI